MSQTQQDFVSDVETIAKAALEQNYDISDIGDKYFGGFLSVQGTQIGYYGFQLDPYNIVCSFMRKTETINQNDPDLQTSQSAHTVVKFYQPVSIDISELSIEESLELARDKTKNSSPTQTGYYKGYRLQSLEHTATEFIESV